MEDYSKKFYSLDQFFSGYFFQDWENAFVWEGREPMFEDVVKHYKTEDSEQGVKETIDELTLFLNLGLTDEEIHKIVSEDFSSWYTPRDRGINKRQFLEKVLIILKEPIELAKPLKRVV